MKVIHHVVDIDAPAASVWRALTELESLRGWWTTSVTSSDTAVGGTVTFTFAGPFNPVMEVLALDEGSEARWRCVAGVDQWKDNTFRFQLVPDGTHTRLRFWQDYAVELSDDEYGAYNFNWGYYLESLRLLCVTGTGKPFEVKAGRPA